MELTLQILLGLITFICLAGGSNLLIKGVGSFLPKGTPAPPLLDNIFRFVSAIYFSLGFLMLWIVLHVHTIGDMMYLIGVVVTCSGLGRFYSRSKVGSAGKYTDFIMLFEIVLGITIGILQYLR